MKKSFVIIFLFLTTVLIAQKSEFRYFSFKLGTANNYIFNPSPNDNLLMRTPYGDFFQTPVKYTGFTPGGEIELFFHIDAKNDKFGFVFGGGIKNYGNSIQYVSNDGMFSVIDQYRATAVVLPVFAKMNPFGLYLKQAYFTTGLKFYINLFVYNIQNSNWLATNYVRKLSADEFHRQSTSVFIGFNYNVFYFDFEYQLRSLLNKDYRTLTDEGLVMPYSNLDYQSNMLFSVGAHIPMTRWITMRSWTAEKIRRMFAPVR